MIEVRVSKWGGVCSLVVEGHAGAAPKGRDIVCAAASALVYALDGTLRAFGAVVEGGLSPGRAVISCGDNDRVRTAFLVAAVGFAQLQASYPQFVRASFEGLSC